MRRPTLVPYWRRWYRMLSNQAKVAAGAVLAGWQAMPPEWQDKIPASVVVGLACALLVLGVVGSLVQQPRLHETRPKQPAVDRQPWAGPPKE